MSEATRTREEHWCRLGLLAAAMLHWAAAGLMAWQQWFPQVSETAWPERGSRLAGLLAGLFGAA